MTAHGVDMMPRGSALRKRLQRVVAVAALLVATLSAAGQTVAATPQSASAFEVASVRLSDPKGDRMTTMHWEGTDRFTVTNASLEFLVQVAYGVEGYQIEGLPDWADNANYDINAKVEGEAHLTYDQLKPLLQQLLAERLHLEVRASTRQMKGYVLMAAKGGPKLKESQAAPVQAYILSNGLRADSLSMDGLAQMLTHPLGRPVVNKTGLPGSFVVKLEFAPADSVDSSLPSIFTALSEQMGLKVEPQPVPVAIVQIVRVEHAPTAN